MLTLQHIHSQRNKHRYNGETKEVIFAGDEVEENANEVLAQDTSIQLCCTCDQVDIGASCPSFHMSCSSQCRLCCLCFSECIIEQRQVDIGGRD
jgi:hypothetical protein